MIAVFFEKEDLKAIANAILDEVRNAGNSGEYDFDITYKKYIISGTIDVHTSWKDESFSHEFGVESCGREVVSEVENLYFGYCAKVCEPNLEFEFKMFRPYVKDIEKYINNSL